MQPTLYVPKNWKSCVLDSLENSEYVKVSVILEQDQQ